MQIVNIIGLIVNLYFAFPLPFVSFFPNFCCFDLSSFFLAVFTSFIFLEFAADFFFLLTGAFEEVPYLSFLDPFV